MTPSTTSLTLTRPSLALGLAFFALGQTSHGQTFTLAEWNDYTLNDDNPADFAYSGATVSVLSNTGSAGTIGGGSEWSQVINNSGNAFFDFTIEANGGPLRIDRLTFSYRFEMNPGDTAPDLTVSAVNRGDSFLYDNSNAQTQPSTSEGWTFGGSPIVLADGESETFRWDLPEDGGTSLSRYYLGTVNVTGVPEPSHAVLLTGLMTFCVMGHRRRTQR